MSTWLMFGSFLLTQSIGVILLSHQPHLQASIGTEKILDIRRIVHGDHSPLDQPDLLVGTSVTRRYSQICEQLTFTLTVCSMLYSVKGLFLMCHSRYALLLAVLPSTSYCWLYFSYPVLDKGYSSEPFLGAYTPLSIYPKEPSTNRDITGKG